MPVPAPNTEQATAKLNELWNGTGRYLDVNDWRLLQVGKLGRDLLRSDAVAGRTILSGVAALSGNVSSSIENADMALRLSYSPPVLLAKAGTLSNLGFFSQAGHVFRAALSKDVLPVLNIGGHAVATGSILALDEALSNAGNMPTAVHEPLRTVVTVAAAILRRNKVTDIEIGTWLDKAGEIMREHRLIYVALPLLFATREEDFDQVDLSFLLDADPADAATLNMELVDRCITAGTDAPDCFSFGFRSRPQLDERLAA